MSVTYSNTMVESQYENTKEYEIRLKKSRIIVRELYPNSGFYPYIGYFLKAHRKRGMGEQYWWSLVYGGANFSLTVGGIAPGGCAGPLDVKHYPRITDPMENIDYHCNEMKSYYAMDRRGYKLIKKIFLPANPRDWGGRKLWRTHIKHKKVIKNAYKKGKLP